jgi:hypothetical protein
MFKGAIRTIVFVIGCLLVPYAAVAETLDSTLSPIGLGPLLPSL